MKTWKSPQLHQRKLGDRNFLASHPFIQEQRKMLHWHRLLQAYLILGTQVLAQLQSLQTAARCLIAIH